MDKIILAIDIGGATIKTALVKGTEVLQYKNFATSSSLNELLEIIKLTSGQYRKIHNFDGIGIGLPGLIDFANQKALFCPNLPYLNGFSPDLLGENVKIANDADLALCGEVIINQLKKTTAMFTLGTGIGGALFFSGAWPFELPFAGEFGHLKIAPSGPICGCGQRGCLEAFIGSKSLLGEAKARISPQIDSVKEIFSLARDGNPKAAQIVREFSEYLGLGIANVVNITGAEVIILGGQIAKSADVFLSHLPATVGGKISFAKLRSIEIRSAFDPEKNALIGATALFD